jgi:anti-anti-sigma factor
MGIEVQDIDGDIRQITLSGRLDIQGTSEIELKFTAYAAAAARRVVVDLTQVNFLASIGIRAIITNAKALQMKGGKMVMLVTPASSIEKTLETTGVDTLVPMFIDRADAMAALTREP